MPTESKVKYLMLHHTDGQGADVIVTATEKKESSIVSMAQEKGLEVTSLDEDTVEQMKKSGRLEAVMANPRPFTCAPRFDEPVFHGEHPVYYTGPCCARCKNRYKQSDFCRTHHTEPRCYRFKLEK